MHHSSRNAPLSHLLVRALSLSILLTLGLGAPSSWAASPGEIRWFDLVTEDATAAKAFYTELLGWGIEISPSGSFIATLDGRPVAGISQVDGKFPEKDESTWLAAILVADLPASVNKAKELGAQVLEPISRVEGYGSYAVIEDPQGAPAMLVVTERELGGLEGPGAWAWAELWTDDIDASSDFYSEVIGYDRSEVGSASGPYPVFTAGGEPRAGLVAIDEREIEPAWAPYLGVESLGATISKAKKLGGKVLLEPDESLAQGRVALLADPVGGAFFIYELAGSE